MDNAPFLVTKLKIRVLPCVLAFVDGVSIDRLLGFEGLGNTPDNMTTMGLETRLLSSGVIQRAKTSQDATLSPAAFKPAEQDQVHDDDDGWD